MADEAGDGGALSDRRPFGARMPWSPVGSGGMPIRHHHLSVVRPDEPTEPRQPWCQDGADEARSCGPGPGSTLPRVIWMLWLQGWQHAPELVQACAETWRRRNSGWTVRRLDQGTLADFVPAPALEHVAGKPLEPEALSDVVRLELLTRYGGVWADATVYCLQPLDDWLGSRMTAGFFAFARPAPDRMLSSWFLAAAQGSHIVRRWREAARHYWEGRTGRDHYFWVHRLFAKCHALDAHFRDAWNAVPTLSADGPHRFQPYEERMAAAPTFDDELVLATPRVPLLKLTHKRLPSEPAADSVTRWLCDRAWAAAQPARRTCQLPAVLVAWYGSFPGHGTIGDLLSLESVVTRLAGEGWQVSHASAADHDIPGSIRVDHEQVDPRRFAAMVFVCGPIIAGHPQTSALFARFRDLSILGVGVSLFEPSSRQHTNPFRVVLARQGRAERFEDVALVAPLPATLPTARKSPELVIGLALRGPQSEYGTANCLWERTERLAWASARHLLRRSGGRVEPIENHLTRSGLTPSEIEARYAACDLVISSRFHGCMLAMRHGVPFVAIDQIRGGGKVAALLAGRGWPHVLRADAAGEGDVVRAATRALAADAMPALAAARAQAVRDANLTLHALTTSLEELCGVRRALARRAA